METKFNSQICTTREQSERLLALGLKKETADIEICCLTGEIRHLESEDYQDTSITIPEWSLHRLIEMTSDFCDVDGEEGVWCCESRVILGYRSVMTEEWLIMWNKPSLYDNIIDCIEWLIKGGYFNKEYLV